MRAVLPSIIVNYKLIMIVHIKKLIMPITNIVTIDHSYIRLSTFADYAYLLCLKYLGENVRDFSLRLDA